MAEVYLWPDPRESRVYRDTRRHWLAGYEGGPGTCVMCGWAVDTSLPGVDLYGPTVEHLVPVRWMRANAASKAECEALACDTSGWRLAHRRCQSRQGADVVNAARASAPTPLPMVGASREW